MSENPLVDKLLAAVLARRGKREGAEVRFQCPCPARHNNGDAHPSARFNPGKGVWTCDVCHAGGGLQDLAERLRLVASVANNSDGRPAGVRATWYGKRFTVAWTYRDEAGHELGVVARYDGDGKKAIIPHFKREGESWKRGAAPAPRPLFGLDLLAGQPNASVYVVEGEKCAATIHRMGGAAVASPGGAAAAQKADWSPLRSRRVVVWPDNDAPGARYGEDAVRFAVEAGANSVTVLDVATLGLPNGGDVVDWLVAHPGASLRDLAALPVRVSAPGPHRSIACEADASYPPTGSTVPATSCGARGNVARQGTPVRLDDPEPWPQPVEGSQVLDEIAALLRRFVILPDGGAEAVSLWVILAHAFDTADVLPLLVLLSPVKQCGKTTLLSLLEALVPRPLPTSNITSAALFRTVEEFKPTLLIDEADSFLGGSDEMRGILDSGHTRSTAFTVRTVGSDFEPRRFSTWCPKVLALIGRLPDTIEDRSVILRMRRRAPNETIDRLRLGKLPNECEAVRRRAARWAVDNLTKLRDADPAIPDGLSDRGGDNWRSLLAIADAANEHWPKLARKAALTLSGREPESESPGVLLLADLRDLFTSDGRPRIVTEKVLAYLRQLPERPWAEWSQGAPLTEHGLARLLRPFQARPTKWREGPSVVRGYACKDFSDAFSRYLLASTPSSATCATPLTHNDLHRDETATCARSVAAPDPCNSLLVKDVAVVAISGETKGAITVEEGDL